MPAPAQGGDHQDHAAGVVLNGSFRKTLNLKPAVTDVKQVLQFYLFRARDFGETLLNSIGLGLNSTECEFLRDFGG